MSALSERQRELINPFNASWVADVNPIYGTEDPARIHLTEIVDRKYLPFFLTAAKELTKVGLGPFNYEIAERQIHPDYADRPLTESFVALDYTGPEDRRLLSRIISSAKDYYWRMKNNGASDDVIEREVTSFTRDLADLEPGRIQAEMDSFRAGLIDNDPNRSIANENRFFDLHFKVVDYQHLRKDRLSRYHS
jgi:hypothetical protein